MDDSVIISFLSERKPDGLEYLEENYKSFGKKLAKRFLSSLEDAEECVNDALHDVWRYEHIDSVTNLKGLVASFVRRQAIDRIRHNSAQKRDCKITSILSELDEICDPCSLDDIVDANELSRQIKEFISTVEPGNRQIFVMRYFYAMEISEIAKTMHITRNAVDKRLSRQRTVLKRYLGE